MFYVLDLKYYEYEVCYSKCFNVNALLVKMCIFLMSFKLKHLPIPNETDSENSNLHGNFLTSMKCRIVQGVGG
jgi:hypothetical protein